MLWMDEILVSLKSTSDSWYSTRRAGDTTGERQLRWADVAFLTLGVVDEEGRNVAAVKLETLGVLFIGMGLSSA